MSLRNLRHIDLERTNNASFSLTQLPGTLLDAFIPGYSVLSRLLLDTIGLDITAIVSIPVLLFAVFAGGQWLFKQMCAQFLRFYSSSLTVDHYDPIYDHLLAWAASNKALQTVRQLRGHSAGENTDNDGIDEIKPDEDFAEDSIFNFNNWAAKAPPRYEPHTSSGFFWHRGLSGRWNFFKITRDRERVPGGWMGMGVQDQEKLTLTVVGRSTKPLKDLVVEVRDAHLAHQTTMTVIRRPSPKEQRGRGRQAWNKVAARPSRPMATVVLDDLQKATILRDINDFLHPKTPRWYANRGIPYRRGYLFHGPPGTGKTSLSFALAGVFGLDIYCLSLSEATLTEEDLIMLFNNLPRRCVVLLEDIDTAGVLRKDTIGEDGEGGKKRRGGRRGKGNGDVNEKNASENGRDGGNGTDETSETSTAATAIAKEVARAMQSATDSAESSRKGPALNNQGITMSGLLNAIDGVASQEGRVLVMTTNYPEKLDDALVRPGRVDMKIEFRLASQAQIRELFERMYTMDEERGRMVVTKISEILPKAMVAGGEGKEEPREEKMMNSDVYEVKFGGAKKPRKAKEGNGVLPTPPMTPLVGDGEAGDDAECEDEKVEDHDGEDDPATYADDIERLATKFANCLPDGVFSPAEIQGFLLTRKKSPLQAVLDVPKWRDEEVRRKEKGKNVVVVEMDEEGKAGEGGEGGMGRRVGHGNGEEK